MTISTGFHININFININAIFKSCIKIIGTYLNHSMRLLQMQAYPTLFRLKHKVATETWLMAQKVRVPTCILSISIIQAEAHIKSAPFILLDENAKPISTKANKTNKNK